VRNILVKGALRTGVACGAATSLARDMTSFMVGGGENEEAVKPFQGSNLCQQAGGILGVQRQCCGAARIILSAALRNNAHLCALLLEV